MAMIGNRLGHHGESNKWSKVPNLAHQNKAEADG